MIKKSDEKRLKLRQVYVSDLLWERVRSIAEARECSCAEIVRKALVKFLKGVKHEDNRTD
jgi:hypothetical protein